MMQFNIGQQITESMKKAIKSGGKSFKLGLKDKAMVIFGKFSKKQQKKLVGMFWLLSGTRFSGKTSSR